MENLSHFEQVLFNSGLPYQGNKIIDDFFLTGKPGVVREQYRSCQENVADRMIHLAELDEDLSMLESGAGTGVILKKMVQFTDHSYCEINTDFYMKHLHSISKNLECFNFFELEKTYDRIIMNPPFSFNQYVSHIMHGYKLLNQNGIMVFLYPKNAALLKIQNTEFIEFLEKVQKFDVGKVCGECECIIGKVLK